MRVAAALDAACAGTGIDELKDLLEGVSHPTPCTTVHTAVQVTGQIVLASVGLVVDALFVEAVWALCRWSRGAGTGQIGGTCGGKIGR